MKQTTCPPAVVVDTNVLVAAGFSPDSASGRVVRAIRQESLKMIWNDETRDEARYVLRKIPPLSWTSVADLFRLKHRYAAQTEPQTFSSVPDPDDRKFAALAATTGAALLTLDDDLLEVRYHTSIQVYTPSAFLKQLFHR